MPASGSATVLGVDAGASCLRWLLRRVGGTEVARGRIEPWTRPDLRAPAGSVARIRAEARIEALGRAVRDAARDAGVPGPTALVAGVHGLVVDGPAARAARRRSAEAFGLPEASVRVVNDMRLAYRSAFEPGEGVLVYTGTGAIAVHVRADGELVRAGGHGPWIDGAGGGFWIGARALRTVLRRSDRRGRPADGALADALYEAIGANDPVEIRTWTERGGTRAVSDLVPAVRSAALAGDPDANTIVTRAGTELARLADALLARVGPLPVGLAGGASGLGPPLRRALVAALPPGTRVRMAERTPVETAATLAELEVARPATAAT